MTGQVTAEPRGALDPRADDFVDVLGAFLLQRGALDELALRRAQRAQHQSGERFDLVLTRLGLISDAEIARHLAALMGLRVVEARELPDIPLLADQLHAQFLTSNRVIPVAERGETIIVATADPFNTDPVTAIGYLLGRPVEQRLMAAGDVERAIERLYGRNSAASGTGAQPAADQANEEDVRRLEEMASQAPVIRLVHQLISRAVEAQGSDIP